MLRGHSRIITRWVPSVPAWVLQATGAGPAILDIDFVNNRAWNKPSQVTIPSLLTCTRASIGYYTDASGNLSQFGNNVLRYGTNGLLVEESRTNSCFPSQNFTQSGNWVASNVTDTANATAAPDGTSTADLLVLSSGAGLVHRLRNPSATIAAAAVYSVFVKAAGYTKVAIREDGVNGTYAAFSLGGAGSVLSTGNTGFVANSAIITALANGWYRISFASSSAAAGQILGLYVMDNGYSSGDPVSYTFTADGVSGAYFWGAQIEAGAFPTSYIPTTSSSATRAADVVTYAQSLSIFTPAAGTFYTQVTAPPASGARLVGDSTAHSFLIAGNNGTWQTADQAFNFLADSGVSDTITAKIAAAYSGLAEAISANGNAAGTANAANAIVQYAALRIGSDPLGVSNVLNGYMKRLAFWNSRLSNAALQALTT